METLRLILRYAHLIAFAMLLGGAIVQYLSAKLRINDAMFWGSIGMLVTGVLLAAPFPNRELDYTKIGVKAVLAVLIFGAVIAVRKKQEVGKGHFLGIVGMTLLNAAVAVFWR
ncbi:hypothetical protein [Allorhizocola rhizosphaerae]|uniref:hypothetical protein n=1 Tax=Allorhizocola rhizosphaerae TaxID=1872709 RepID=UPI000E3E067F|nr:hypothetical protein [Allorhizocola rhizosphaerae]